MKFTKNKVNFWGFEYLVTWIRNTITRKTNKKSLFKTRPLLWSLAKAASNWDTAWVCATEWSLFEKQNRSALFLSWSFFIYRERKGSSAIVTNTVDVSYFLSLLKLSLSWLCFCSDLLYLCIFPEAHSSVLFFNSVSDFTVSPENYWVITSNWKSG